MKQLAVPLRLFVRRLGFLSLFLLLNSAVLAQEFQNPYWVMQGNPPILFKNSTPTSFPGLPFTVPGFGLVPYSQRIGTAVNGVFDECGDPLFYVAGDWVFDENGNAVGELKMKDNFEKTNTTYGNPGYTENFEAVICEVPASPGEYFVFCSDYTAFSSPSSTLIYVYQYNAIAKVLDPTPIAFGPDLDVFENRRQARFALSQQDQAGGRILYVVGGSGLAAINIPSTAQNVFNLTIEELFSYPSLDFYEPFSELELNHDGTMLAWATKRLLPNQDFYSVIHFYDLQNSQHSTFQPFSQAIGSVSGLEFLPDDRLAASLIWNEPYQSLDGIGYFNSTLTGFNLINNSSSYSVGMIELGISTSGTNSYLWSLYGIDHNDIVRIPFSGSGTPAITNTINYNSASLVSPNFINNRFSSIYTVALPDQVDGEAYPFSTDCGGGDGNDDGRDRPEFETSELTEESVPTITFSPLITITNHE